MKKLIICVLAMFVCSVANAQISPYGQHNMAQGQYDLLKYWNLRDRMDWWVMKGAAHTFGNCPDINSPFSRPALAILRTAKEKGGSHA